MCLYLIWCLFNCRVVSFIVISYGLLYHSFNWNLFLYIYKGPEVLQYFFMKSLSTPAIPVLLWSFVWHSPFQRTRSLECYWTYFLHNFLRFAYSSEMLLIMVWRSNLIMWLISFAVSEVWNFGLMGLRTYFTALHRSYWLITTEMSSFY